MLLNSDLFCNHFPLYKFLGSGNNLKMLASIQNVQLPNLLSKPKHSLLSVPTKTTRVKGNHLIRIPTKNSARVLIDASKLSTTFDRKKQTHRSRTPTRECQRVAAGLSISHLASNESSVTPLEGKE
jgi:hypothetical protein